MTPEEFKIEAMNIYVKYRGYTEEEGHSDIDDLMTKCLKELGYGDGLDILWSMKDIWYA